MFIVNKELIFQNEEKGKRAAELMIVMLTISENPDDKSQVKLKI